MRHPLAQVIIFICDVLALAAALAVSAMLAIYISQEFLGRVQLDLSAQSARDRVYAFTLMSCAVLFAFYNRGHYVRRIPWWSQVRYIMIVLFFAFIADGFVHFAVKYHFSRLWIGLSWSTAFVFLVFGRFLSFEIASKFNVWRIPTIVIGSNQNITDTLFAIYSDDYTGYDVQTLIVYEGAEKLQRQDLPAGYQDIDIIEGIEDYAAFIREHSRFFYIVAPHTLQDIDVEKLLGAVTSCGSNYAFVPPIQGVSLYGVRPQYFFGHDVMFLAPRSRATSSPLERIIKRGIDVVGSACALVLLSPFFLYLAVVIRRDGGAALYHQKRVGRGGEPFRCWKFRTMVPDADKVLQSLLDSNPSARQEWEMQRKLRNDPRVTKVGELLRKTSMDEFPQLWNVLKGDMSLVGPRPIVEEELQYYDKKAEYYLSVRPGITGLWQVSGRSDTSYRYRVYLDSWYVQNSSLWHDVVIIIKTIMVLVKREGAY